MRKMKEDNILIAKFMGCTEGNYCKYAKANLIHYPENFPIKINFSRGGNNLEPEWLEFNSNWSWLMPVVEKIESFKSPCYINGNSCTIYEKVKFSTDNNDYYADSVASTKLKATYLSCVAYIKWYNKNKQ